MEAQKLCTLVILVSFLALVSFVSSQPEADKLETESGTKTETPIKKNEQERLTHEIDNNVCKTEVCRNRVTLIRSYLNNSISPCDDFYGYVCENWINKRKKEKGPHDSFQMMHIQYIDALTGILESLKPTYNPQGVIEKTAVLFNACVALTTEDEDKAILDLLNGSQLTNWPMAQSTGEESVFKNATEVLLTAGMSPVIVSYVSSNSQNQATHIIKVLPMGIRDIPNERELKWVLKSVKFNITDDGLKNLTSRFQKLQYQWRLQVWASIQRSTPTTARFNIATIGSLESAFKNIPLHDLLTKEFAKANVTLEKNETVEVYNPVLYESIDGFLGSADPVDLYNYMGFKSVHHWLSWSPLQFTKQLYRRQHCASLVSSAMKEVVVQLYAKKYFNSTAKLEVEEIAQRIKYAFEEVINGTTWMDEETRASSRQKLQNTVSKIGYPKWVLNTTVLESLYKHVPTLYPNMSFLNMRYAINENNDRINMEKLRQAYNNDMKWFMSPSPVNAFFDRMADELVYPAGGIQSPFYEYGLPWSLNFGGVGAVIAHEYTHGFARVSHSYGNEAMVNLTENELKEFQKRAQCFEHQYGNITDKETEILLNGTTTLNENMADNSGLLIALKAYENLVMDDCGNTTTSLDGLPGMSGRQLFFVGYAMAWCSALSENDTRNKISKDSHSPNRHRVNVPLQNLEAFATTFNCTRDSPMFENSTHNCTLW